VRPELTLRRASAHIARRWWLLPICALLVTLAALTMSGRHISNAKATGRVHDQDTTVSYQFQGQPQPFTVARSPHDLTKNEFVDPQVADAAARALGDGTTGSELLSNLGFAALTGTDIQLSYSDGSSQGEVIRRLSAYEKALVHARIAAQRKTLTQAADTLRSNGGPASSVNRLETAAHNLPQQIKVDGQITSSKATTVPHAAVLLGGILAGLILGAALALAWGQADPRIRSLGDLRAAGVRALPVDTGKGETIAALRVLAEVGGVDSNGGVIAVVTPHGESAALSRSLAGAFAHAGRPTTWLAEGRIARSNENGWSEPEAAADAMQSLPKLRKTLAGTRAGEVVVIDAPGVLDDPEGLVATAVATVTVLSVRRGRSKWGDLESTLELLEDSVVGGRVRVALDRGRKAAPAQMLGRMRASQPAAEQTPA
jgi:hypothetical protein